MKKALLTILALVAISVSVRAEAIEDVTGNRQDRLIEEMKDNWHRLYEGATFPNTMLFPEVTIDGKYAVVGGDATTGLMIQKAAITSTATALQTNSFAVAYGAAPNIMATYTEDPGDVRPIFIVSVTTSNFVASVTADKNFAYVAVGTRP